MRTRVPFFTHLTALLNGQPIKAYLYPPSRRSLSGKHKARIYLGRKTVHGTVTADEQARLIFTPNENLAAV